LPAINSRSLTSVATGTGPVLDTFGGKDITLTVIGSAGITSGAVTLEGSADGTNFGAIGSAVNAVASSTVAQSVVAARRYVRARITTPIVGGTVTVYVTIGGLPDGVWRDLP